MIEDDFCPPQTPRWNCHHEKLLEVTLELLIEEGSAGLSTARISKAAGIVQSGFYAHFASLEECVVQAAEQAGQRLRQPIVDGLTQVRLQGASEFEPVLAQYLRSLELFESNWRLIELVLRYFREPSPLGRIFAAFMNGVRADLSDHLLLLIEPPELRANYRLPTTYLADLIVNMFLTSLETLMREPSLDRGKVAELLARQTLEIGAQVYGWVEARPETHPHSFARVGD